MWGKDSVRKPGSRGAAASSVALAAALALAAAAPARAGDGLWDRVLEKFDVKAAPPGPAPDFVERTRPDPSGLGYLPTALPHKVSPRPVKTAAEIAAEKDALDAAKDRQLNPGAPAPTQLAKGKKPAKTGRPAAAAAD